MSNIIESFWGNKWNWKHVKNPDLLFNCYKKRITIPPTPITLDFVIDAINTTSNTAPGPDTIDFEVYRSIPDIAGPVFFNLGGWKSQE